MKGHGCDGLVDESELDDDLADEVREAAAVHAEKRNARQHAA